MGLFRRAAAPPEYGVVYVEHNIPKRAPAATVLAARVLLRNIGQRTWLLHHPEGKRVDLVVMRGPDVWATHQLPRATVGPGEEVAVHFPLRVPTVPGR